MDKDKADYRSFFIENPINKGVSGNNEHFLEHLNMAKNYTTGVYKGYKGAWYKLSKKQKKDALSKRWYVRWSYRNPETGKLQRQSNIYMGVNTFATYKERIRRLKKIEDNLIALLNTGLNPYSKTEPTKETLLAFDGIKVAMEIKRLHMKESSFVRFRSDIGKLKKFLSKKGYERRLLKSITKKEVTDFLNEQLKTVSARSRNNYRGSISALWQQMENDGLIERNFVKSIPMLKSIPQRNKAYTDKEVESIFKHLKGTTLLLFVKFVAYSFLRPIEVCRLTAQSFDLNNKRLTVMVKQGKEQTKTIPDILLKELPDMDGIPKHTLLFGKEGILTPWSAKEDRRRAYFTSEFTKVRDGLGLDKNKNLYSFRHWSTGKIYNSLRESGLSPFETKSKLMQITGHATMKALEKYLRTIDVELAEDFSNLF